MSAPETTGAEASLGPSVAAVAGQEPVRRRRGSGPPVETTFLFVLLLIMITLSCSVFLSTLLTPPGEALQQGRVLTECLKRMGDGSAAKPSAGPLDLHTVIDAYQGESRRITQWGQCMAPVHHRQLSYQLGGLGVVFGTGMLLYLGHPAWYERRRRLSPLSAADAADLLEELERLRRLAGVGRLRFRLEPFNAVPSAFVFGLPRRRTLALSTGLVVRHRTDPAAFRAVVLHELAHLRNRDIEPTYLALTLTASFGMVLGADSVNRLVNPGPLRLLVLGPLAQALLLGVLTLLLLAALVRSREFQADARVAEWEGDTSALPRVLRDMPVPRHRVVAGLRTLHPTPAERARRFCGTSLPFGLGYWGGVGAGLTTTVTLMGLRGLSVLGNFIFVPLWMSAVPGVLVAAVVVVGRWRYESAHPEGADRRMWPYGLGLATGTTLAPLASPDSFITRTDPHDLLVWIPGWILLVLLTTVPTPRLTAEAVACWHRMTASRALPYTGRHLPAALLCAVAMAAVGYSFLTQAVLVGQSVVGFDDNPVLDMLRLAASYNAPVTLVSVVVTTGLVPVLLAMGAVMVVLSVLAVLWRTFCTPSASPSPSLSARREVRAAEVRRSVRTSLAGTALLMVFLPLTSVLGHRLPLTERWHSEFFARFYFLQMGAAVVAVVLTALVATARARHRPLSYGLLTAAVSAAAASPVVIAQLTLGNCIDVLEGPVSARGCLTPPVAVGMWVVVQVLVGWTAVAVAVLLLPCAALRDRALRKRVVPAWNVPARVRPPARLWTSGWCRAALALTAAAALSAGAVTLVDHSRVDPATLAGVSIGDRGWIDGGDFRMRLAPGWYDVTRTGTSVDRAAGQKVVQPQMGLQKPGFGQRARVWIGRTTRWPIDDVTPSVLAEGGHRTTIAGARALVLDVPEKNLHIVLIERGREQLRLELTDHPDNLADATHNLDVMLSTWQWT
ncbi:M48 family metalloprotease [Streptomyces sp. NPDC050535]|uniref:M48 family metalloprotease n=1 Tax=Streptomyces sp. NPDC050535 TaxID=3365626 RepID=UPI00379A4DED